MLQGRLRAAVSKPVKNCFDARALLARQFILVPDGENTALPILGIEHTSVRLTDRSFQVIEVRIDKMERMYPAGLFRLMNSHCCPKKKRHETPGKFSAFSGGRRLDCIDDGGFDAVPYSAQ